MRIAICPGSFDPVTNGHIDIIERSAQLFDKIIVLVLMNKQKNCVFTTDERVDFIRRALESVPNVEVDSYNGLLADYAAEVGACALIKGLRAVTDFEYEFQMALTNKILNPKLETLFMNTNAQHMYLSSSMVREVAGFGGDISRFVPDKIVREVAKKLSKGAQADDD